MLYSSCLSCSYNPYSLLSSKPSSPENTFSFSNFQTLGLCKVWSSFLALLAGYYGVSLVVSLFQLPVINSVSLLRISFLSVISFFFPPDNQLFILIKTLLSANLHLYYFCLTQNVLLFTWIICVIVASFLLEKEDPCLCCICFVCLQCQEWEHLMPHWGRQSAALGKVSYRTPWPGVIVRKISNNNKKNHHNGSIG